MIKINFKNYDGFIERKVTDENGKEIISFEESKALPTHVCYSIINSNKEKIGKIEKSRYNFGLVDLPKVVISVNNEKIVIEKDMQELKEFYEINGSGLSINGNLDGPEFNISKNENILAFVGVEKEETNSTYLVDLMDKSNEAQVLCILFGLSWIR